MITGCLVIIGCKNFEMDIKNSKPKTPSEAGNIIGSHLVKCIEEIMSGKMQGFVTFLSPEGIIKFRECDTTDFETFKIKNK